MSIKKAKRNKVPLRECISCSSHKPKAEMMRIVITNSEDGDKKRDFDESGKVRGRGAYICRSPKCIDEAFEKGLITEEEKAELHDSLAKYAISMLSIAAKAGKICSGEVQCEAAISDGKASLVIIAGDASPNTEKKFSNKCTYYKIPYIKYGDKEAIGRAIGRENRSCVAVTDDGIADCISLALNVDELSSEVKH